MSRALCENERALEERRLQNCLEAIAGLSRVLADESIRIPPRKLTKMVCGHASAFPPSTDLQLELSHGDAV